MPISGVFAGNGRCNGNVRAGDGQGRSPSPRDHKGTAIIRPEQAEPAGKTNQGHGLGALQRPHLHGRVREVRLAKTVDPDLKDPVQNHRDGPVLPHPPAQLRGAPPPPPPSFLPWNLLPIPTLEWS